MYDKNMRRNYVSIFFLCLANTLVVGVLLLMTHNFIGVRFSGTPLSDELTMSNNYRFVTAQDGRKWWVVFQVPWDSTFSGKVRDVTPWNDAKLPFMTHDVLVTNGGFADPEVVRTSVQDHIFIFRYWGQRPNGNYHPMHTFPASAEVLAQLEEIQPGDVVRIRGREILMIRFYNAEGDPIGQMTDQGCISILVTGVEILPGELANQ